MYVGAIYRYYESRRHIFNDNQPERVEVVKQMHQKAKCIAYRKKVPQSLYN